MAGKENSKANRGRNNVFLGLAYRERSPSGRWRIKFRWGIIVGLILGAGVFAYCAIVTALFFYFKQVKDFKEVNYWDMYTLVFNQDEHRAKIGDYQIGQAKLALEEGDLRKAFQYLRTGVIRSPENLQGRALLAEFLLYGFRPPDTERAVQVLRDGVPYAYDDSEYLKKYLKTLLATQEDSEVVTVADSILTTDPSPETQKVLALAAATASYYRGNFDAAENYVKRYNLEEDVEGALLIARIYWDRGQKDVAIAKLEADIQQFPVDEPFYELLTRFHRQSGDNAKARQYAVLRNINAPLSIAPRIDLLFILNDTDQQERANREAESILQQFADNERGLQYLANYATDTGNVDLSRKIYERALENNFNIAPFSMLLIEAYISEGDYKGAIDFSAELIEERPDWLDNNFHIFNSLRAVAYYGLGNEDLTDLYLQQFLQHSGVRVESLMAVSNRFEDLGGIEEAREVLLEAYRTDPDNQAALSKLIAIEIEMGNSAELGPYLKNLLKMRRPSSEILTKAYKRLGSDQFIFTRDRKDLLIELEGLISPQSSVTSSTEETS